MERAGLFIGVQTTGQLPILHDAVGAAERMHTWALEQGFSPEAAALVTDKVAPVTPERLQREVRRLITDIEPEQLIIYYSGHGSVIRMSEHWLLTDAPALSSCAIDLTLSADFAGSGPVPHVVFISDACRTATADIQAGAVQGQSIFPTILVDGQRFVDVYFSCGLGRAATEVAAPEFRAVYTELLLGVLSGAYPDTFQQLSPDDPAWYAEVRKVRNAVSDLMPEWIRSKGLSTPVGQRPYAKILSDPGAWLARLDSKPKAPASPRGGVLPNQFDELLLEEFDGVHYDVRGQLERFRDGRVFYGPGRPTRSKPVDPVPGLIQKTVDQLDKPFSSAYGSDACGLSVRGDTVAAALSVSLDVTRIRKRSVAARPYAPDRPAGTVLLRLTSGLVVPVPVCTGYVTRLTMDKGELLSMEFEAGRDAPGLAESDEKLRTLRAKAAAASAFGRFEATGPEFAEIARAMQDAKVLDPALAVYAAHAYTEVGNSLEIRRMAEILAQSTGMRLFDLELLADPDGRWGHEEFVALPGTPLLSQGWSFTHSRATTLSDNLRTVAHFAVDSLWSAYTAEAFPVLEEALSNGELG